MRHIVMTSQMTPRQMTPRQMTPGLPRMLLSPSTPLIISEARGRRPVSHRGNTLMVLQGCPLPDLTSSDSGINPLIQPVASRPGNRPLHSDRCAARRHMNRRTDLENRLAASLNTASRQNDRRAVSQHFARPLHPACLHRRNAPSRFPCCDQPTMQSAAIAHSRTPHDKQNAHRCDPPGGNPGCGRQGKPRRGI
jgi:hypothetical protein